MAKSNVFILLSLGSYFGVYKYFNTLFLREEKISQEHPISVIKPQEFPMYCTVE
jgi:hypothetical protein